MEKADLSNLGSVEPTWAAVLLAAGVALVGSSLLSDTLRPARADDGGGRADTLCEMGAIWLAFFPRPV